MKYFIIFVLGWSIAIGLNVYADTVRSSVTVKENPCNKCLAACQLEK